MSYTGAHSHFSDELVNIKSGQSHSVTSSRDLRGEHDVQVKLLKALEDAVEHGRDRAEVVEIFRQLVDYTKVHFMSEQLLMRLYAYPQYEPHEQTHNGMIDRLTRIDELLAADDTSAAASVARELRAFVMQHIDNEDHRFARYLSSETNTESR